MKNLFLPLLLMCMLLSSEYYNIIAISVSAIVLLRLIDKFGKGIILLETMAFYTCLIYLIMPIVGYEIYSSNNKLARLWLKFMPVPEQQYFSFVLPAVIAFVIGLLLFSHLKNIDEGSIMKAKIQEVKQELVNKQNTAHWLLGIGVIFYFVRDFLPGGLAYIGNLGFLFLFPGVLYIFFNKQIKRKYIYYLALSALIVVDALRSGMFTILFYMGLTIASIIFIGRKIPFSLKLFALVLACFFTVTLQYTKVAFRKQTWRKQVEVSKFELFRELYTENALRFGEAFSPNTFFPIYSRLNQGFNTALVIRRIPSVQPFDNGRSIANTVAASVIPRLLWPDKPESGGKYNMLHFAGMRIRGWSTNIGPIGEGYGNFGVVGGVIFCFVFGLFIGVCYKLLFVLAEKLPLLILWIPLLFYEVTFCMENDTLQALNSIIKATFFLFFLYKLFPSLFKRNLNSASQQYENSSNYRSNRPGWSIFK